MNLKEIQKMIRKKNYLFSEHADEERMKDKLIVADIEQAILSGSTLEERLDDARGESRLISGKNKNGKLIHIVIGLRFEKPVIVTVYTPSKKVWTSGKIRKKYE